MLRESEGTSRIICSGSGCGGFYFENVSQLDITNLSFISDSQSITVAYVFEVRFVNCTFANSSNTAVVANDSSLLLEGNVFTNNSGGGVDWTAFKPGGGISVVFSSISLRGQNIFQNNTCISNTTLCGGGAMYAENSTVKLEGNSSFVNNIVMVTKGDQFPLISGGGGLFLLRTTVDITGDVHFTNNRVSNAVSAPNDCTCGGGGALVLHSNTSVSGDVTFSSNVAVGESGCGGGMYVYDSSVNVTESVVLVDNHAGFVGGGIMTFDSSVSVSGSLLLADNSGGQGGGLTIQQDSNMDITGTLLLTNNSAHSLGGGMYVDGSCVNVTDSAVLIDNHAGLSGGGIQSLTARINIAGTVSISKSSAGQYGGGVAMATSNLSVSGNLLLTGNSGDQGGGLNIQQDSSMDITGTVALARNSADSLGGGIIMITSSMSINGSCLLTDNTAGTGGGLNIQHDSSMDITGTLQLTNNSARQYGGGIGMSNANMSVSGSLLLTDNSGGQGGGLNVQNSNMDITGTMVLTNNSADAGGGMLVGGCGMTASGSVSFINNSASTNGGGAFVGSSYVTLGNTLFTADNGETTVSASVLFTNNSAGNSGGGVAASLSNITLLNACFMGNRANQGGGMDFQEGNLFITGTVSFINNSAGGIGGGMTIDVGSATLAGNVSFTGNHAIVQGGGIGLESSNMSLTGSVVLAGNHAVQGGGIDVGRSSVDIPGTVLLTNNSAHEGGGINLDNGKVNISGSIVLTSNHADADGGGMTIDYDSQMALTGNVYFIENSAVSGGAIYFTDVSPLLYCASVAGVECVIEDCFFQVDTNTSHSIDKLLVFEGNIAEMGSVLFGGSVDRCTLESDPGANSGEVFDRIANYSKQLDTLSPITSEAFRVCLCEDHQVCTAGNIIRTYPGKTISVRVAAVGQRNGTHPAAVNAITSPSKMSRLNAFEDRQVVNNSCTELNYTTFSNESLQLELYVDGSCSSLDGLNNHLYIPVHLLHCPHAFELSDSTQGCICEERLRKFTNSCDINDQTIERDGDFWVGYDNDNQSSGLILHPHCPFDYCQAKSIHFTLNHTDRQCNGDRSGLLCGACRSNRSLALGSSRCLSCSDAYLSLLVPFAVMGVVLVFFLLACRLTVALGTLSGLVFYANIVQANRNVFFPPGSSNPLTVFIAWVNLDLGIETCFYDGMDAYAKTWLQFAFPIYIWGVIGIIMFISSLSFTISRILGKNPVAILATLFLLSYAKILRNIITALSLATLQYPNESQVVWLNDANIRYLGGKHIPLFVVGLLVFVLLFLPYTLLLLFGQWLLAWSNLKILFWMNNTKLKAFFDSYHSPYKEKHRYWTGLLLVVRFVLLLVFGTNVFGEESENLLAISAASFGLLAWPWLIGTVYKNWYLGVLEASFILNLGISAAATSYVQQAGGNQAVVSYISTGIAFVTFIAILLYHIDLQIKVSQFLKVFCRRGGDQQPGNEREREILVPDAGGRALDAPARPYYGSGEFREPLLADAQ